MCAITEDYPRFIRRVGLWTVQAISLSRATCALVFASIAFIPHAERLTLAIYLYASISDSLDGGLARLIRCTTIGGAALDIACDKYLTIFSVLFLVSFGAPLLPCCLALTRDLAVQAFRSITIDGHQLFQPIRAIGLTVVIPIRFTVGYALLARVLAVSVPNMVGRLCWVCGVVSLAVLVFSIASERKLILRAFDSNDIEPSDRKINRQTLEGFVGNPKH